MRIKVSVAINLKVKRVEAAVEKAAKAGLKDVVLDIAKDAIKGSPKKTGNNRRSIRYEVKGFVGKVYSTSGYGGYLEVGTRKMAARPYFRPALDKHRKDLPKRIKERLE